MCGNGGKFRDIYACWETKVSAVRASFHRIGSSEVLNRQTFNEAFTSFLKLLKFPCDDDLFGTFVSLFVNEKMGTETLTWKELLYMELCLVFWELTTLYET